VEQRSLETYVDLLQPIDGLFAAGAADADRLQALRDDVVAAFARVENDPKFIAKVPAEEAARRRAGEVKRRQETERAENARAQAIRQKKWPLDVTDLVIAREVAIGMTAEQVKVAWGDPLRINETQTRYVNRQQWVYGGQQYLYFENGRLTTIQRSR